MLGHVFLTQLKRGIRDKQSIFWCLAFPIALGTLMNFAFGSIYDSAKSTPIDVRVIVEEKAIDEYKTMQAFAKLGDTNLEEDALPFVQLLEELEYEDGTKMIHALYEDTDEDIANTITISGLNQITLEVSKNSIESSILSTIISTYKQNVDRIISVMNDHPEKMESSDSLMEETTESREYVKVTGLLGENKDPFVSYFYNIMAMVCTMCSMLAFGAIVGNQANQTVTGIRVDASPVNKFAYELAQYFAINLIQLAVSFLALVYFLFVLKVKFGGNLQYVFLTTALGTFLGTALGYMVGHFGNISRKAKENILVLISIGGGFLAGLMVNVMKAVIETKCPIINRINPSAVITDAFYALNVYGPGARYYRSISYIVLLTVAFIIIGAILSRRKQYASL